MLDYMVLYASRTGNTKMVAKEIFAALPGSRKDIRDIDMDGYGKEAETYFVGFGVNRGGCDVQIMDALSALEGKKVALFGTCGMGNNEPYFKKIEQNVRAFLPEECEYLGIYMCQGKMQMPVRNKYEQMLADGADRERVEMMIRNFDEALLHPDKNDLEQARKFAERIAASL